MENKFMSVLIISFQLKIKPMYYAELQRILEKCVYSTELSFFICMLTLSEMIDNICRSLCGDKVDVMNYSSRMMGENL